MKDRKKVGKFGYGLFSPAIAVSIFIMTAVSVFFALLVFGWLSANMGDELKDSTKWLITAVTFLALSLSYSAVTLTLRRLTVKNPVMKILDATKRIGQGDFSVRLPVRRKKKSYRNEFDAICANINAMTAELSGIETLRQDFIANVSHEFKAPLAVIQNSCTVLCQPGLMDEAREKYAKNAADASFRLAGMITDILNINKLENSRVALKPEKLNAAEFMSRELLLFEHIWEKKDIDIGLDADEDLFFTADASLLSMLVRNLLSNAFKFTPENGKVTVAVTRDKYAAVISVADTGPGIPEESREKIFEKFFQKDVSNRTAGNGLGLALAKTVADTAGWTVKVGDAPGGGALFTVRLPQNG